MLQAEPTQTPRVLTVAKKAADSVVMDKLKADETMAEDRALRQLQDLNCIIEPEYRNSKRLIKPMT
ncbi:hypothetical protein H6F76_01525 [Leptolyngbya sp. FACHB-321]|nr:hypothetical protein [Leptolyngbya sp. FACHB-321]